MPELDGTADLDRRLADALERFSYGTRALAQRSARTHGLTPLQQQTLLALDRQPVLRREVKALAAEFDVTSPTMSDAVSALVEKGLVTRTPGVDARRRVLALTAAGQRVVTEVIGWSEPVLTALERLSEDDKATMLAGLRGVIAELQRREVISVARACTTCRFFRGDVRGGAMYCGLLEAPLTRPTLRTDCPEHQLAEL